MPGFRCSSLRLGSDNRACVSWLAPTANSLGVQLTTDPLRLSLSFNLLESYHSILKLSTRKCAYQGKMYSLGARPTKAFPSGEGAPTPARAAGADEAVHSTDSPKRFHRSSGVPHLTRPFGPPSPKGRAYSYSLLRMILPLMVLGSSSRNSTILGYL